jgi:hypothetical protein
MVTEARNGDEQLLNINVKLPESTIKKINLYKVRNGCKNQAESIHLFYEKFGADIQ